MKRTKIIYGIGISLIVLVLGFSLYLIILSNFYKLSCFRQDSLIYHTINFNFDITKKIVKTTEQTSLEFYTVEGAKSYYEENNIEGSKHDGKMVIFKEIVTNTKKNKKLRDVKKEYKSIGYACRMVKK